VNAPAGPHAGSAALLVCARCGRGCAPGHGGPTGPGDAPAPADATPGSSSERSRNDNKQTDGEG
jgi:hypothetical protein